MPRINRKKIPKHILIPDTNILWDEKKVECASSEFSEFWLIHAKKYQLELVLPEVVRGELLYQHTSSAFTALDRINKQFNNLSAMSNKEYVHALTPGVIRRDVATKFDRWMASIGGRIEATPINTIDWKSLIGDAIWRRPPFTEDKDKKSEKGFRDALILETVFYVVSSQENSDIVFVSDDKLLRSSVKERLKKSKNVKSYESLSEFSSYLRMIDEKLTNEFVIEVQERAMNKFHSLKDKKSLIFRENIIEYIRNNYSEEFDSPDSLPSLRNALLNSSVSEAGRWKELSKESIWITSPAFLEIESSNIFTWESKIIFVQLFKYDGMELGTMLSGLTSPGQENIRKVQFNVLWDSTITQDARFRKMNVRSIEFEKTTFELATYADRDRYLKHDVDD